MVSTVTEGVSTEAPSGTFLGSYYMRLMLGPYERPKGPFGEAPWTPNLTVMLPLPTELRDDTSVSYTNVNLETVGDLINGAGIGSTVGAAALRTSGNIVTAAGSVAGAALKAGAGAVAGDVGEKLAGGINDIAASLFPAEQITSAIQQSMGLAPNPNPSVQFQGPVLRDFAFTWAFYPKNKSESANIDKMIRILKGRALAANRYAGSAAILKFPDLCQLNFYPWDTGGSGPWGWSPGSIIKIKKCVMQGVNVSYNAFGTPAFFEETQLPVTYQLTISFKEVEYLLADDWSTSGYTQDGDAAIAEDVLKKGGEVATQGSDVGSKLTAASAAAGIATAQPGGGT